MSRTRQAIREHDLGCARELSVELDVEQGAERLAALIAAGAAAPIGGAGIAAGAGFGLFKGATAKLIGVLLGASAATGAALLATSAAPVEAPAAPRGPGRDDSGTRSHAHPTAVVVPVRAQAEARVAASAIPEDPRAVVPLRAPAAPVAARAVPLVPSGQPGVPAPSAFGDELRGLAAAKALITTAPQAALDAADAAPRGELDEEREIVAIRALLALGRRDEASVRAARFCAAHPNSPFRAAAAKVAAPPAGP